MGIHCRLWHLSWAALLVGLFLAEVSHAQPGDRRAQARPQVLSPADVTAVAAHLTRTMATSVQAESDPRFVAVQITTCPIQISGQSGVYLYQEQALVESLGQPYRQRFLEITLGQDAAQVESRTFKPPLPSTWTGLCQQVDPVIAPNDLGELVCVVELRPSFLGYVGHTPAGGCPVNLWGAVRLTNTVVLHPEGMDTWDRGFDQEDMQVWGAESEPYRYRWVDQER